MMLLGFPLDIWERDLTMNGVVMLGHAWNQLHVQTKTLIKIKKNKTKYDNNSLTR